MKLAHFLNQPVVLKGFAIVLWIASSVLAVFAINGAVDVGATIYAAFWARGELYGEAYRGAVALRWVIFVPGSVLALIAIIGNAEYQFRRFNTPGAWRLFGYILGAEAGILLLAAML